MATVFTGTAYTAPVLGKLWDPRYGWRTTLRISGKETDLLTLLAQYKALGYRVTYDPDENAGYGKLIVELGNDDSQPPSEALSDQWSLVGNDLEKVLWETPVVQTAIYGGPLRPLGLNYSAEQVAELRSDIEDFLAGKITLASIRNLPAEGSYEYGVLVDLYIRDRNKGVESFTVSQYVLRRTIVIAANSTIKPALENVGKVYTTDQLRAAENIPSTIKFDLAAGYWLKRTPTVEQTSWDKWTITQEWWHADNYSDLVYERVT